MKKMYLALVIIGLVIASCGGSEKGAWSDEDKELARAEVNTVDLSFLGDKKDKFVDCYLKKVEQNYESFDAANADEAGCTKLVEECTKEIMK
jgi:hypothetical protein